MLREPKIHSFIKINVSTKNNDRLSENDVTNPHIVDTKKGKKQKKRISPLLGNNPKSENWDPLSNMIST